MFFLSRLRHRYPVVSEYRRLLSERKALWEEAAGLFREEKPSQGSLRDYKNALKRHRVSYREYMYGYEFWKLDEKGRGEFVSQRQMNCIYRKVTDERVKRCFIDKKAFLSAYSRFVGRKWLWPGDASFEAFQDLVSSRECVAKPMFGSQGDGIFIVSNPDADEVRRLWQFCRENNYLVEERVGESRELAEFHPQSLNTIRIVTKTIKGFRIPYWKECLEMCEKATQVIPEVRFAGWDICVMPDGKVEMIEGNAAPNVDGGLQVPLKKGIKQIIQAYGKELFDFDPVALISVWSRSRV